MRAAIEGLAGEDLSVLLTAGFQERPEELPPLPDNFREAAYLPGLSLARRCDLMVHHGGHGSCMTSAFSGTPALIVPTYSERESNARRLADLGAAGMHVPGVDETGEKHVDGAEFARTVQAMLAEPSYRRQAEALSARMKPSAGAAGIAQRIEELL
jgi:UDP:flavonoid glycosyltransferase YjiC (YdhE family)